MGQDGNGLSFSMLLRHFSDVIFGTLAFSHKKNCGFREGPFQMGVSYLGPGVSIAFSGRLFGALYQSAV